MVEGVELKLLQHGGNTALTAVVIHNETKCMALDCFHFIDVPLCVGIPDTAGILGYWSDKGVVALDFDYSWAVTEIAT